MTLSKERRGKGDINAQQGRGAKGSEEEGACCSTQSKQIGMCLLQPPKQASANQREKLKIPYLNGEHF